MKFEVGRVEDGDEKVHVADDVDVLQVEAQLSGRACGDKPKVTSKLDVQQRKSGRRVTCSSRRITYSKTSLCLNPSGETSQVVVVGVHRLLQVEQKEVVHVEHCYCARCGSD